MPIIVYTHSIGSKILAPAAVIGMYSIPSKRFLLFLFRLNINLVTEPYLTSHYQCKVCAHIVVHMGQLVSNSHMARCKHIHTHSHVHTHTHTHTHAYTHTQIHSPYTNALNMHRNSLQPQ